jgi:hypothetical protein
VKTMTALVLLKPHTHAGKTFSSGERIDADDASAQWLLAQAIAAPDSAPQKTQTEGKPAPVTEPVQSIQSDQRRTKP